MSPVARELLDLVFRWLHVIAGIMWIGNSMLWNWMDRNLEPSKEGTEGIQGEIWLLHSGAFYYVQKDSRGWDRTRPLHWFKWQAYTTWLSGAALLIVVYYASTGALLLDASDSGFSHLAAVGIGVGVVVGGWIVYDAVRARVLDRAGAAGAAIGLLAVVAVAYGLAQVFSGRAAFLHVGAMLGTLMAGNVGHHIMPSQRALVNAVESGGRPDPRYAKRAKSRSIHNNYITFPVIVLMLSSHFPGIYGHRLNWLLLGILALGGASVRHILNVRLGWPRWKPALATAIAGTLAALYLVGSLRAGATVAEVEGGRPMRFAEANAIIQKRCAACHSASPADLTFGVAPAGVAFDTPEQIRTHVERIRARAVETQTMPPANKTHITPEERALLGRWIAQGARVD
ncbi:urate hydroxylase PuuD [Longimicrobium sp.]|uniref:urate hydroxylase PuuD n=1 Tax=Longimicrobium sp. TaxID=2029185 RepID=UPI003B3AE292